MCNPIDSKIQRLQAKSQVAMTEAIAVFVFALFATIFLPQLLVRYFYAGQALFEEPALLTYIPVVAFIVGTGWFIWAAVANFMRSRQIAQLERETQMYDGMMYDEEMPDLAEMEALVDEILEEAKAEEKKAAKKSSTKKSSKKSTAKKTTKKSTAKKSSKK